MLAAAAVRRGGSEAFFIGSHFQRCQMKMMETLMMPLLLSMTCFIGNRCHVLSNSLNYCLQLSKWDSITML
ncbi:hypothetical protein OIU79_011277 [Salix purpurea]|uniref:Uncharacterized protein n=1 Tax=Salix purpurea TaxID=77065 RepID=A0A9Q0Q0C6_SALPP|nr:hypothetical protein OIU79_011277 [Salix purpurea]